MKTKRIILITAVMVFVVCVVDSSAEITDVNIVPPLPTPLDEISIITFGLEGWGDAIVTDSVFSADDSSLNLDIYITLGYAAVETPWSHSELIGTLFADTYDLTVIAHYSGGGLLDTDTYLTSFEVVPEPATIFLLSFGGLFLKRARK